MLRRKRITWLVRVAARDAHAQMGSLWVALAAGVLIAIIPIAAITGFEWEQGTEVALLAALLSYPITFLSVVIAKALEQLRHGHPHFVTQVDIEEGKLTVWLSLKDGASPQAVDDLGLLIRRRGERGHAVRLPGVAGTRTIDRVGPMPPHITYPDDFPAALALEPGVWQIIWSDVRRGKRREFLFHELEILPAQAAKQS